MPAFHGEFQDKWQLIVESMKSNSIILALVSLIFGTIQLQAQESEPSKVAPLWSAPYLITDRPDQTESSSTVTKNTLQIETGFIFENYKNDQVEFENLGLGTTLLRYGVWDNFELRLGSYYQQSKAKSDYFNTDTTQSGMGPILAGFKVYVVEEKGIRPEIAILADLTLNSVGKLSYRPSYTYSTIKVSASHTLSNFFSLGYNLGIASDGENPNSFFVYSLVVGMSLAERLGGFAEIYGTSPEGGYPNTRIDGGLTYLIRNNLQVDVSGGMGLGSDVDLYFVSCGITWRIPR